jgi:type I restriction enzyme S subunit
MMFDLPEGWEFLTVAELAGIGGVVADGDWIESKDQDPDGDVRLIQLADIGDGEFQNRSARFLTSQKARELQCTMLEPGDLLIARMPDPLGRACLYPGVGQPSVTAVDVFIWRAGKKAAYPSWLMHTINSPQVRGHLQNIAGGTTRQRVSGGNLKRLALPTPPKAAQVRIATKLDNLLKRSKSARGELDRIPKLMERYRQAILAAAFSENLPNNQQIELGRLATFVTSGSRGWAKYYSDSGATFVRVANVRRDRVYLDLSEIQCVTPPEGSEGVRTKLEENDIVVTITADLGRVGVIPPTLGEAYVNQHVALVRLSNPSQALFIAWFLTSEHGQSQLLERNRGMTKAGLGLDDIRAVKIPDLPALEQDEVVRRIETTFAWLDRMMVEFSRANSLLARLDQATLAKAFRGELGLNGTTNERVLQIVE